MNLILKYLFLLIGCVYFISSLKAANFNIAGEWLYMLPAIEQPYFVINRVQVGLVEFQEERIRNHQDWQSGYRVDGICFFNCCQNSFQIRWTHFPTFTESKQVRGNMLVPVITIPAASFPDLFREVSISDSFDFYYSDILFGQNLLNNPIFSLDLLLGIQYDYLKLKEEVNYVANSGEIVCDFFSSRIKGIGIEVGSELAFRLSDCFLFHAKGYGSLLACKRIVSSERLIFEDGTLTGLGNLKNEDLWAVLPIANLRAGFIFSCKPLHMIFGGGYEMIFLTHAIDRYFVTSPDPAQEGSIDQLMNFSLHGPYIRLGFCY
ncbi:MAG: Lpg1974 family pore-forming outer membrane protein [Chlamydiales bacterium]